MRLIFSAALLGLTASGPATPLALNQLGFEPDDPKLAIVAAAGAPVSWTLVDAAGREVARGEAQSYGADAASGDTVQRIDFSAFRVPGKGYRLVAGGRSSDPFEIGTGIYAPLARDALAFFYHQRAGVPIEARFVGAAWARPAGHPKDRPLLRGRRSAQARMGGLRLCARRDRRLV